MDLTPNFIRRLHQATSDSGIPLAEIDRRLSRRAGWLSGVLSKKQKSIKTSDLEGLCKLLSISEDWLRGKTDSPSPSMICVSPEPPARPDQPQSLDDYLSHRHTEIQTELAALRERISLLEDEAKKLTLASRAIGKNIKTNRK